MYREARASSASYRGAALRGQLAGPLSRSSRSRRGDRGGARLRPLPLPKHYANTFDFDVTHAGQTHRASTRRQPPLSASISSLRIAPSAPSRATARAVRACSNLPAHASASQRNSIQTDMNAAPTKPNRLYRRPGGTQISRSIRPWTELWAVNVARMQPLVPVAYGKMPAQVSHGRRRNCSQHVCRRVGVDNRRMLRVAAVGARSAPRGHHGVPRRRWYPTNPPQDCCTS